MKRLAIITTHPIQYNAPWFKMLAKNGILQPKVFYTWAQREYQDKYDAGFDKKIEWDVPLLEGYDYVFVKNTSSNPGSSHFTGMINPTLIKEIACWKPDAILVFGWSFLSHLKCLLYFHNRIPVFFRGDSTLLDEKAGLKKRLRRWFLKWVYRHIDFAFYVGTNNKEYFLSCGLKSPQLIYAPHAIDNSRFAHPNEFYQKQAFLFRENVGIKESDLVILFAGKFEQKKNPLFLMNLLELVKDKRLKIVFVGSGDLMEQIKLLSEKDNRVIVMGFQNQQQMPVIYRMADIFILPSVGPGETWGLALNEAMASGLAVVATDKVGGAIDLIQDNCNGLIIDLKSNEDLIRLINNFLHDKVGVKEMGRQSYLKIQDFSFQDIVSAVERSIQNS